MSNMTHWKMENGTRTRIKDMEDRHLINTIRMLTRKAARLRNESVEAGYTMLGMLQEEMAMDGVEQELFIIEDTPPGEFACEYYPIYKDLMHEALDRGLKI